ncbi:MAG: hypothetical protein V1918_02670 [Planctomycetota bacterium]
MRRVHSFAACLTLLHTAGNAGAIEFDQRAGKMGLKGLAWDTTFTVYASDHDLAKETLERIQDSYAAILGQLNQKLLRKKCLVFVWRDRAQYILHAGMFYPGKGIGHAGAFVVRNFWGDCHALFTSRQDELYDRILPHELAHLVFPLFLGSGRIPLWLNEGFAQCQEEGSFDEALAVVNGEVKKGKQYTLAALTRLKNYPSPHERNALFYDQSELLVKLLIARQKQPGAFFDFARALTVGGKGCAAAFAACYPQWNGPAALQKEYFAEVERLAADFSRGRYRAGYLRLQAAKGFEHRGACDRALEEYSGALDGFVFLEERYAEFRPDAVKARAAECRDGMRRVSGMTGGVGIGDPRARVVDALGKPEADTGETLRYHGAEIGFDEKGRVASIAVESPYGRPLCGLKAGDPLCRAEMLHGMRGEKRKGEIMQALLGQEKLLSMDRLEPGTYPVRSKGKFLGQVIRLEDDPVPRFIAPMAGGAAVEEITVDGDRIEGIEFRSPEEDDEGEGQTAPGSVPHFEIGDSESRFTGLLGKPMGREPKLFVYEERRGHRGEKMHSKSSVSDRLQAVQLLYDGLYVVIARGSALCIVATPPCNARVCGVAVGDSRREVTRVLGSPEGSLYGGNAPVYYMRGGKVKVSLSINDGRVVKVKAFRTEFQGMKLHF